MLDWTQVEERIVEDDRNKWDRKAAAEELRIVPDGLLDVGIARFALSELATSQMCQRLGIPVLYYRRLPHELQAMVANHDFARLHENAYLLRGKDEWVRAFLSTDYVAYNNAHIAETVKELLRQAEVSVKSFVLEETHLYLKVISEEVIDRDSGLKAGIMIGNSEVGTGSISIEPFVYRLACTNDLVVSKEQSFRHPHTRLTVDELRKGTALAISIAFKVASSALDTRSGLRLARAARKFASPAFSRAVTERIRTRAAAKLRVISLCTAAVGRYLPGSRSYDRMPSVQSSSASMFANSHSRSASS